MCVGGGAAKLDTFISPHQTRTCSYSLLDGADSSVVLNASRAVRGRVGEGREGRGGEGRGKRLCGWGLESVCVYVCCVGVGSTVLNSSRAVRGREGRGEERGGGNGCGGGVAVPAHTKPKPTKTSATQAEVLVSSDHTYYGMWACWRGGRGEGSWKRLWGWGVVERV